MDALLKAITVVLPVIAVLVLGNLFARFRDFREAAKGLSGLVYWVCLPALVWRDVARADPVTLFDSRLCFSVAAVLFLVGIVGYRYARWRKAPVTQVGVIAQASFRSNMLYVGLPVLLYHAAATHADKDLAAGLAAMTFSIAIPVLNAGSIFFFILPRRHDTGRSSAGWMMTKVIVTNPMILAVLVGLCFALVPGARRWIARDAVLGQTLDLVASAALPMALFSVGALLQPQRAWNNWRSSAPIVALKLIVMPALGMLLLWHLGVRELALAVGTVLLACPTAAASHALALELGGDEMLAGDLVAVTTLVCPFTLVGWLTLLQAL